MTSLLPLSQQAMTAGNIYLISILQKYSARDLTIYSSEIYQLKTILQTWAGPCYLQTIDSGSRAKGTAIFLGSDVDYLVSLTANSSQTNGGLKGIYDNLFSYLGSKYPSVRKQNVSVRIHLGTLLAGIEVDVTPAQKHTGNTNYHSLYTSKSSTSWIQTNTQKHIYDISQSGRINEIKLLKIWRELYSLDFSSIYLEYLLITKVLLNRSKHIDHLENNFFYILQEFAKDTSNPLFARIIDPANSANVLSDLLSQVEKNKIISVAKQSIKNQNWGQIIW